MQGQLGNGGVNRELFINLEKKRLKRPHSRPLTLKASFFEMGPVPTMHVLRSGSGCVGDFRLHQRPQKIRLFAAAISGSLEDRRRLFREHKKYWWKGTRVRPKGGIIRFPDCGGRRRLPLLGRSRTRVKAAELVLRCCCGCWRSFSSSSSSLLGFMDIGREYLHQDNEPSQCWRRRGERVVAVADWIFSTFR